MADLYVVVDYCVCDYVDLCVVPDTGNGGGGSGSGAGHGKKPAKPGKPHGARAANDAPSDFRFASTSDFDQAVEDAQPPPPPREVLLDDIVPVPPINRDAVQAAMDAADSALLGVHEQRRRLNLEAVQAWNARVAAQHANWDQKAKIIAIVNATMAS